MAMNYGLLSQSARYSKNPHPVLYHLAGKLFGLPNLGIYFMAYAYGKWIDDQIDSQGIEQHQGQELLERQRRIMATNLIPQNMPEKIGAYLGAYFRTSEAKHLGHWYAQFFHSLDIDLRRKFELITADELQKRAIILGSSFINFCQGILAPDEALSERLVDHTIKAYIQLDMLLDLEEDLKVGYCNIPLEYLENALPDPQEIFFKPFGDVKVQIASYVYATSVEIRSAMQETLPGLQTIRSLPFRFFLKKMYEKRLLKLDRLDLTWRAF